MYKSCSIYFPFPDKSTLIDSIYSPGINFHENYSERKENVPIYKLMDTKYKREQI